VPTTVKCAYVRLRALMARQSARLITNPPIAMGNRKRIGSLFCLRTNRARNCTAIRTQIRIRVECRRPLKVQPMAGVHKFLPVNAGRARVLVTIAAPSSFKSKLAKGGSEENGVNAILEYFLGF
jgi:hypothetical protein